MQPDSPLKGESSAFLDVIWCSDKKGGNPRDLAFVSAVEGIWKSDLARSDL